MNEEINKSTKTNSNMEKYLLSSSWHLKLRGWLFSVGQFFAFSFVFMSIAIITVAIAATATTIIVIIIVAAAAAVAVC